VEVHLGKTIRILRQAKGLSMKDLAEEADVSTPFLSLVERGARQPSLSVLRRIAEGLRVPPELLILLAAGPEADLQTDDTRARELRKTVAELVEIEQRLCRVLSRQEKRGGSKKNRSKPTR